LKKEDRDIFEVWQVPSFVVDIDIEAVASESYVIISSVLVFKGDEVVYKM
jgi:hypothetical protein